MTLSTNISPNEPDSLPQYVDMEVPDGPDVPAAPRRRAIATELRPAPEPSLSDPAAENAKAARAEYHREGECVPNVPDGAPELVREDEVKERPAATAELPPPRTVAPPWLRWHLVITVFLVSVLGILVFGQAASTIALAGSLPLWARYGILIPLGVCCLAALGVAASLILSWLRLRAVQQVDVAALEELRRRAENRRDGVEHYRKARTHLEGYLRLYPLSVESAKRLRAAGLAEETIIDLRKNRDYLNDRAVDSRSWLEEFRLHFQVELDRAAERRIRLWSLKAAGCVIASPLPLLDSILVLGISLKLIKDLAVIYNVRSSRTGTVILLNRTIVSAFIAGVADNAVESAAAEFGDFTAESTMGAMGARMAGIIGPKLGEGAINAFFIHRLGHAAMRLLQPLRP